MSEKIQPQLDKVEGNYQWESGEKEAIQQIDALVSQETDNSAKSTMLESIGAETLADSDKTIQQLFEEFKKIFESCKDQITYDPSLGVTDFITKINSCLQENGIKNKTDVIALLQTYINAYMEVNCGGEFAVIPYGNDKDSKKRLVVDGILGPHSWNAFLKVCGGDDEVNVSDYLNYRGQNRIRGAEVHRIEGPDGNTYELIEAPSLSQQTRAIENGVVGTGADLESYPALKFREVGERVDMLNLWIDGVASTGANTEYLSKLLNNAIAQPTKEQALSGLEAVYTSMETRRTTQTIAHRGGSSTSGISMKSITALIKTGKKEEATILILRQLESRFDADGYVAEYIAQYRLAATGYTEEQVNNIATGRVGYGLEEYTKKLDKERAAIESQQYEHLRANYKQLLDEAVKSPTDQQSMMLCVAIWGEGVTEVPSDYTDTTSTHGAQYQQFIADGVLGAKEYYMQSMKGIFVKRKMLDTHIRTKESTDRTGNYNGQDQLFRLYADIEGIGYMNPSSETRDQVAFWGKMIAEEALCFAVGYVTAGVGTVVLKSLLYGGRAVRVMKRINTGRKILKGANRLGRLESRMVTARTFLKTLNRVERVAKRSMTGSRFLTGGTALLELAAQSEGFRQGSTVMHNILHGQPWGTDLLNGEEALKMMVVFGAMKVFQVGISTGRLNFGAFSTKAPGWMSFLRSGAGDSMSKKFGKVVAESLVGGGVMFGIEGMGELIIDGDVSWTQEEFLQAVMMYMIFRVGGSGTARMMMKKVNGKIVPAKYVGKAEPVVKVEPAKPAVKVEPPKRKTPAERSAAELATKKTTLEANNNKLIENETKIKANERTIEANKKKIEDKGTEISAREQLKRNNEALKQENAKLAKDNERLVQERKVLETQVETRREIEQEGIRRNNVDEFEKSLLNRVESNAKLRRAAEKGVAEKQKIIESNNRTVESNQSEIQRNKDKIKKLKDGSAAENDSRILELQKRNDELGAANRKIYEQNEQLGKDITKEQDFIERAKSGENGLSEQYHASRKKELARRREVLEEQNKRLKDQTDVESVNTRKANEKELKRMEQEVKDYDTVATRETLKGERAQLEADKQTWEKTTAVTKEEKAVRQKSKEALDAREHDLRVKEVELQRAQSRIDKRLTKKRLGEIQKSIDLQKAELKESTRKLNETNQKIATNERALAENKTATEKNMTQLDKSKKDIESAEADLKSRQTILNSVTDGTVQTEAIRITKARDAAKAKVDKLLVEKKALEAETKRLAKEKKNLDAEQKKLATEKDAQQKIVENQRKSLEEYREQKVMLLKESGFPTKAEALKAVLAYLNTHRKTAAVLLLAVGGIIYKVSGNNESDIPELSAVDLEEDSEAIDSGALLVPTIPPVGDNSSYLDVEEGEEKLGGELLLGEEDLGLDGDDLYLSDEYYQENEYATDPSIDN